MRAAREWVTVDAIAAAALAVGAQLEVWAPQLVPGVGNEVVGHQPILAATAMAATLPLAVRRRFPFGVLLSTLSALVLQQIFTTPTEGLVLLIAALVAAYSSSAYSTTTYATVAGVAIVAGSAFIGEDVSDDWAFIAILLGTTWLIGLIARRRSAELSRAHEDNRDLSERLAEAAEQLAEANRRSAAGPPPDKLATLTAREVEVAREIARGMSNAEIATELFITEWTVKSHVASILRKLGLRDRAQVVVAAYESGIVSPRNP